MPGHQHLIAEAPIILWLYVTSQDVLFAVLLGIVGFGFVLTSAGYLLDRSRGVLGRAK